MSRISHAGLWSASHRPEFLTLSFVPATNKAKVDNMPPSKWEALVNQVAARALQPELHHHFDVVREPCGPCNCPDCCKHLSFLAGAAMLSAPQLCAGQAPRHP